MALFGIANAHQEQGAVHTNGASAGQGRRNLLWDQPKEEPKEEEPVKIEPSPVYADSHKFVGPETPKVLYTTAPTPASYETATKVRSDKPYVDIYHRERDWVNAKGATKVDTWEGATYNYRAHSGKGSELRFNSGQRAFEVNHKEKYDVNFPETAVKVDGGMPIAVDHKVAVFGAGANETVLVASGNGPVYANAWAVNVGPTNTIGHGAGRRRAQ